MCKKLSRHLFPRLLKQATCFAKLTCTALVQASISHVHLGVGPDSSINLSCAPWCRPWLRRLSQNRCGMYIPVVDPQTSDSCPSLSFVQILGVAIATVKSFWRNVQSLMRPCGPQCKACLFLLPMLCGFNSAAHDNDLVTVGDWLICSLPIGRCRTHRS